MDAQDSKEGAILRGRENPPSHYWFKIESFSLLSEALIDKYSSGEFAVGGFNWKLSIYPTGDKSMNVEDHISIYLDLVDTSSLPTGRDVNVIVNFFTYNHLEDKYLSFQDGRVRRFHAMKTKWGISKFIDLKTFYDPANGYLVDDTCAFGLEIFVVKSTLNGESLKMMKQPATNYHSWRVTNFPSKLDECYRSESFGYYKWSILLYPNGCKQGKGNSISIFLDVSRASIPPNTKLFVKCMLHVADQWYGKHIEFKADYMYGSTDDNKWGRCEFLPFGKLKDLNQGYLLYDGLLVKAEVTLLGMVSIES